MLYTVKNLSIRKGRADNWQTYSWGAVWSDSALFVIQSASLTHHTALKIQSVQVLGYSQCLFQESEFWAIFTVLYHQKNMFVDSKWGQVLISLSSHS